MHVRWGHMGCGEGRHLRVLRFFSCWGVFYWEGSNTGAFIVHLPPPQPSCLVPFVSRSRPVSLFFVSCVHCQTFRLLYPWAVRAYSLSFACILHIGNPHHIGIYITTPLF